jgi:hypothetical protein
MDHQYALKKMKGRRVNSFLPELGTSERWVGIRKR